MATKRKRTTKRTKRAQADGDDVSAIIVDALESPEGQRRLCELQLEEQRAELDPQSDRRAILDQIAVLVARAERLSDDPALAPGLEALHIIAGELRSLLSPFGDEAEETSKTKDPADDAWRADVRERHSKALVAVRKPARELAADKALRSAATIGNRRMLKEAQDRVRRDFEAGESHHSAETVARILSADTESLPLNVTPMEADALAIQSVRRELGAWLPAGTEDKAILEVVELYRQPERPRGWQRGDGVGERERTKALVKLLGLMGKDKQPSDPQSVANQIANRRRELNTRLSRLRPKKTKSPI